MARPRISIVLPVFNEERILERNVRRLEGVLSRLGREYEIIISEDGSTYQTAKIAKSLVSERVRLLRNGKRAGKGAAVRSAAMNASGEIILFMDADLASNLLHMNELIGTIEQGAEIVVGSRYAPGANARRSPIRYLASRSFNWLVRMLLGSKLADHQCGFKAFRKDKVLPILESMENLDWFWDTELLVKAQRSGLAVVEVPVEWKESQDSRFRIIDDTVNMARSLIAFKLKEG